MKASDSDQSCQAKSYSFIKHFIQYIAALNIKAKVSESLF